jgi:hypothetical protein
VTFVLTGFALGVGRTPKELRNAGVAIALLIVLVAIPLVANSNLYWTDINREEDALAAVDRWLEGTEWEVYHIDVDSEDEELTVMLGGEGPLPDSDAVVAKLREIMDGEVTLTARILGVRKEVIAESADT